jgi:hypothetical protein
MSKMGLHDPFGYLKHALWPKEGSGVKLPIWLPTTKSQESPWFTCVEVTCHIPLKIFWWRLQFFFGLHFNWKSSQEVMGLQSCGSPNFRNFETPNLRVLRQNDIWMQAPWLITRAGSQFSVNITYPSFIRSMFLLAWYIHVHFLLCV